MQAIFQDVIDKERAERDHFLKEVIPNIPGVCARACPEGDNAPIAIAVTGSGRSRVASQSDGHNSAPAQARRKPTMGGQAEEEEDQEDPRLPGVTPSPVTADRRHARREAAMRVLAELALKDAGTTPAPVTARK